MAACLVRFEPQGRSVHVEAGTRLYDAALKAGFRIETPCGGEGTCGKCRVRVLAGRVRAVPGRHLTAEEIAAGLCLACEAAIEEDLTVWIPRGAEIGCAPAAESLLSMEELGRTAESLGVSLEAPGARLAGEIGLALDIGTTVVAGALFDFGSRSLLAEAAAGNLQAAEGADIIHRIQFAVRRDGLEMLRRQVLETVKGIVADLAAASGESLDSIVSVTAAGNTTMTHLLLGREPGWIQTQAFAPAGEDVFPRTAGKAGIAASHGASLWISPWVANYLGGDITAGVLFTGMANEEPLTLYVDLGTNGEIVLGNREWMAGCACSCGPAFEGAGVGSGMRAAAGAVERVSIDAGSGDVSLRAIGDCRPVGICGSGLVDLLAELRRAGFLTPRGRFSSFPEGRRRTVSGRTAFCVVPAEETGHGEDLVITERDIEHLIRSKGAAFAGVRSLLRSLEIPVERIERVVIAGGFGRSLDVNHAIEIGMLPDLPRERFSYIGNGSLKGAALALLWEPLRERVDEVARRITYVDLGTLPTYMEEFVAALFLPHTDGGLFPSVR